MTTLEGDGGSGPEPHNDLERAAATTLDEVLAKARIPATRTECATYQHLGKDCVTLEYELAKPWEFLRAWTECEEAPYMSYQVVFRADQKLLSKLEEVQAAGVFNAAPRANQKPVGELEEMQAADILNVADASRGQLLKYLGMGSSVADTDTLRRWVKEGGGAEDLVSVAGAVREGLLKHTGIAARVTYGEPPIGDVLQSHPRIRLPGRGKHILLLRADFEYTPTDTDEAARSLTTRRDAILGYFKYLRYGKES